MFLGFAWSFDPWLFYRNTRVTLHPLHYLSLHCFPVQQFCRCWTVWKCCLDQSLLPFLQPLWPSTRIEHVATFTRVCLKTCVHVMRCYLLKLMQVQETGGSVSLQFSKVLIQLACSVEAQWEVIPLQSFRIVLGLCKTTHTWQRSHWTQTNKLYLIHAATIRPKYRKTYPHKITQGNLWGKYYFSF